jgi:6-phosphogluconolactonase
MTKPLPESFLFFPIAALCLSLLGCGSSNSTTCVSCSHVTPFLYATTASNQILGFTISSSGTLTPIAPSAGPANSHSIASAYGQMLFADSSSNEVVAESVDFGTGALTPDPGSPLDLGSVLGGPTGILLGQAVPNQNLYASEPNGTIVGYSNPGVSTVTALPGSPYVAGIAPAQMAFAQLTISNSVAFSLYASDPGDPSGAILAFAIASDGSLSPIAGSPFPTAPNSGPSYLLDAAISGNQFLFVSLSNSGQIAGFSIDNATGALAPIPGSPFAAGKGPGMLVSGEAGELFVINTGDHTVEAFNIAANGVLTPIGSPVAVGTAGGGMAFSSAYAANVLYVADTDASSIELVNINPINRAISSGGTVAVSSPPLQLAVYDQFPLP